MQTFHLFSLLFSVHGKLSAEVDSIKNARILQDRFSKKENVTNMNNMFRSSAFNGDITAPPSASPTASPTASPFASPTVSPSISPTQEKSNNRDFILFITITLLSGISCLVFLFIILKYR